MSAYTITDEALILHDLRGDDVLRLAWRFSIGTGHYQVTSIEVAGDGWRGLTDDPSVTVRIEPCASGLVVEVIAPSASGDVVYFSGSTICSRYGRAFVPDKDCRRFDTRGDEAFHLTNSGMPLQGSVGKDDLWMIAPPPHIFAFGDDAGGWCGLSIPEPMPVVSTCFRIEAQRFSLQFNDYSARHDGGRLPRVHLHGGLATSGAIIDRHREGAVASGLITTDRPQPAWWHNPVYCTWGDQCYRQRLQPQEQDDVICIDMDAATIKGWCATIRACYAGEVNCIIDAGWFDFLGDYRPRDKVYGSEADFRRLISELQADGFRVILWYTPFWVQSGSAIDRDHHDWLVHRRAGGIYRDGNGRGFLDFSHPAVREHVRGTVAYLLDDLGADGFKIDMNYTHPLMKDVVLHDPGWGYGNLLWLQVMRFFHEAATTVKADAFFTISGIESYLQPYAASVRLNDLFEVDRPEAWYHRAELVAKLMPGTAIDVDGWPASLAKQRLYQFVSPVFGAPVTYYSEGTDIMCQPLGAAERYRIAATWALYARCPCTADMRLEIDAEAGRFARYDGQGRLRALAIDQTVLVVYEDDRIACAANRDTAAALPLPDGRQVSRVRCTDAAGQVSEVPFHEDGGRVVIALRDAADGALVYELDLVDPS